MEHVDNALGTLLVNDFGDRYLYSVNRNTFNEIGSDALYKSLYGEKLFVEYQFYIIIGTDSGIFPHYIVKNGVPTGSRYLFLELPEVLDILSRNGMLENLPPAISVVTLDAWTEETDEHKLNEYIFLNSVFITESLASTDANLPDYRNVSWELRLELNKLIHQTQTTLGSKYFVLRQLENLAENQLGFAQTLKGVFAGKTAVILAGGPSLKEALPWIRKYRDCVVVIAVSRISRILHAEGIVPHIIASVDPQNISFEVSREMLRFTDTPDSPLFIHSHHASPLLVGQWQGKNVYTAHLFPWQTSLNTDQLAYTGPTVSNYAIALAMHMGCETIVLAGVDLCFSSDGQTHADGSNENKVGPNLAQVCPKIETYGGGYADTNQGYAEAIDVLAVQARMALEGKHRLYNCSLNAAKVPHIDHKPLDEIVLPASDTRTSEIISLRVPEQTVKTRRAHYQRIKKELERARRKLQEILTLSKEALVCTDGLFGRNGMQRDFRHKIRMDKIERRLDRSFGNFTLLVKQFGIRKFLTILKTPKKEEEWTDEQIEKATREYYEAYVEGTEYLIGIMDDTLQRINARIEEENVTPNFGSLFAQWKKDGQFGRALLWQHRNPEKWRLMNAAERIEFEQLEQEFCHIMTEERTSQIVLLEELHDVRHTRSKAFLLYKRGEITELETMARGLANHPNQEKTLPYLHLVRGLIAELRNEPDEAVGHYQHLLDGPPHSATEDAIRQIASLSISRRDIDNALLAVECLAGLSPVYLPAYGDLLKAVGRFEEAFNAYNRYLALVPDDVGAIMKLGIFCREARLSDAASELFRKVLAKDQNNSAAQTLLAELPPPLAAVAIK